ncbi:MAG: efflux RND transporter periplasmic adaptor subunit [Phycisphaeraceae bacterium]|nr:efflux RND transporter periplasmic adaptor subunit [Phycisphaeraceae bacterium]
MLIKMFTHYLIVGMFITFLSLSAAVDAQDEHEGHDHGDHQEQRKETHETRDDHDDHDDPKGHDDHAGHDDHEDGPLRIDAKMLKIFDIRTAKAGPGTIAKHLVLSGEVVFNADRMAHVTAAVAGIVRRINVSVGDRVTQGQVLAVLSSRELAAVRSELLANKARWDLAKENATRDKRLFDDKVGTQRTMLQSQQMAHEANIQYSLTENALHALGFSHDQINTIQNDTHDLNLYELKAPLAGTIIERHLSIGENIAFESTESTFLIADMRHVWVNLSVYQRDLIQVRAGQLVELDFGHDMPIAKGTIAFLSPTMDEQTRTATARIDLGNPKGYWRPGLFVTGKVHVNTWASDLVLPASAVVKIDGQSVVFIQTKEGFEPVKVKTGKTDQTSIQILQGIKPGQTYVSTNAFALKAQLGKGAFGDGHNH